MYRCEEEGICIPSDQRCDGIIQCKQKGEDEKGCLRSKLNMQLKPIPI